MTAAAKKQRRKPPLGIITRPGSSLRNKTGPWGIMRPVFDREKCRGCNTCESICPEGCIRHLEKKVYEADIEFCKGCGMCVAECPGKAIVMSTSSDQMLPGAPAVLLSVEN